MLRKLSVIAVVAAVLALSSDAFARGRVGGGGGFRGGGFHHRFVPGIYGYGGGYYNDSPYWDYGWDSDPYYDYPYYYRYPGYPAYRR